MVFQREELVCCLLLYLKVKDSKTVYFNFVINKQGMSGSKVFSHLKKLIAGVEVANKFVSLLNCLLDNADKTVYINAEEVCVVKPNASMPVKKALVMESPEASKPPACCIQAKCAVKKAPYVPETAPEVKY